MPSKFSSYVKEDNLLHVDFRKKSEAIKKEQPNRSFSCGLGAQKAKLFNELLQHGLVMIALDASHSEVQVPLEFKQVSDLRLNFSYRFGLTDFSYDEEKVSATLSFESGLYFCSIPWGAVFLVWSIPCQKGASWREDVLQ